LPQIAGPRDLAGESSAAVAREPGTGAVLDLIEAFQKSETFNSDKLCGRELKAFDGALARKERVKFRAARLLPGVAAAVDGLLDELDPSCAVDVIPDLNGELEINPCFAGARLVSEVLWRRGESARETAAEFLWRLNDAIEASSAGQAIALWDLFGGESHGEFLALLAYLHASSTSVSGYLDGFGDFIWREAALRGDPPEAVLLEYHDRKKMRDSFRDLRSWAANRKLRLYLHSGGIELTAANRHDFMAAFLACHFHGTRRPAHARLVPRLLGYGYETLDFVSHLKQGVPVRASLTHFERDTRRYKDAAEWGASFCASSPPLKLESRP
jgi:hypothetical protein